MSDKMLSVPQAAKRLGVTPKIVARLIEEKKIDAVQFGERWRVPEGAIPQYIREHSNRKAEVVETS